jgi:hypothetical protein
MYWKVGNELHWRFIDVLSSTDKQTNVFVESAWRQIMNQFGDFFERFTKIEIWSDGAPQHFKVIKTMGFFANFEQEFKKSVTYNFFVSYHGKSACDAHAGVMKKAITQAKLENTRIVNEHSVEAIVKNLKSTEVLLLQDPVSKVSECQFKGGVKAWHKFQYMKDHKIRCYLNSVTSEYSEYPINLTLL